jgi:hypothetical protein
MKSKTCNGAMGSSEKDFETLQLGAGREHGSILSESLSGSNRSKVPMVPAPTPDQVRGKLCFLPRGAGGLRRDIERLLLLDRRSDQEFLLVHQLVDGWGVGDARIACFAGLDQDPDEAGFAPGMVRLAGVIDLDGERAAV